MAKKPKQLPPVVGDNVRPRGRNSYGVLREIRQTNNWAIVVWDISKGDLGPKVCHLFELETIKENI